jgi:hypothetical protein
MATYQYQIKRGQRAQDVVESAGGAIATDTFNFAVDFTNTSKTEVCAALDYIKERILERNWPPS